MYKLSLRFVAGLLLLAFGAVAAGAAQGPDGAGPERAGLGQKAPAARPSALRTTSALVGGSADPGEGAKTAAAYDYRLGPGDRLRVIVFGEESLSGEFFVAGNGNVSLPLIGDVQAAGGTVREFQDKVQTTLRDGYLKDPRVSAEVLTFRPYYILGEIARPGVYPYIDGMTVLNAIATAGGFSYRANKRFVFVKEGSQAAERRLSLTDTLKLNPGDTVRIGERLF